MSRTVLENDIVVGPLAPGATSALIPHGIVEISGPKLPDDVYPDLATAIVCILKTATHVQFRNDGTTFPETATFRCWRMHSSIRVPGASYQIQRKWLGLGPNAGGGGGGGTLQSDYTAGGAGGGAIVLSAAGGPIALTPTLVATGAALTITTRQFGLIAGSSFAGNTTYVGADPGVASDAAATVAGEALWVQAQAGGVAAGAVAGGIGGFMLVVGGDGGAAAAGAGAAGIGGNVALAAGVGGAGSATGNASAGGDVTIAGGPGGADGGTGSAGVAQGGDVDINGGQAGAATNSNGGDININGGAPSGTGRFGGIVCSGNGLRFSQSPETGNTYSVFIAQGGALTNQAAGVEAIDIDFDLARTVEFATGALTRQRAVLVRAPTYAFVGGSTIGTAASFAITGAPILGANATFTESYAFWVQDGTARIDGVTNANLEVQNGTTASAAIFTMYQTGKTIPLQLYCPGTTSGTTLMDTAAPFGGIFTVTTPLVIGPVGAADLVLGAANTSQLSIRQDANAAGETTIYVNINGTFKRIHAKALAAITTELLLCTDP